GSRASRVQTAAPRRPPGLARTRARCGSFRDRFRRRNEETYRSQLDLRLRDDARVMTIDRGRELDLDRPPSAMTKHTGVRSLAGDVAGELDLVRARLGERDLGALGFGADGLERHVLAQRLTAPAVDHARGGTDVGVAEGRHVLLEEVDEAPFAL